MNSTEMKIIRNLISELKKIQSVFNNKYSINDIFSNSKIYEILIANKLDHELLPGHSGSRDASLGKLKFEYKHYKKSSSNHTWTFNDYSNKTIADLNNNITVIFAHIDNSYWPPKFDWYYEVPGSKIAEYLIKKTKAEQNTRKMTNISPNQIETHLCINKSFVQAKNGKYFILLRKIFKIIEKLMSITNINNILTSNKFWELIVALELNHMVCSEQGGQEGSYDAYDDKENLYEYKVYNSRGWTFQDISENILIKYNKVHEFILAVVDKTEIEVEEIFAIPAEEMIPVIRNKFYNLGQVNRKNVYIGPKDLKLMKHRIIL